MTVSSSLYVSQGPNSNLKHLPPDAKNLLENTAQAWLDVALKRQSTFAEIAKRARKWRGERTEKLAESVRIATEEFRIEMNKQLSESSEAMIATINAQKSDLLQAVTVQFWNKIKDGFSAILGKFLVAFQQFMVAFTEGMKAIKDKIKAVLASFTALIQNARTWIDTLFNGD
jgi:dGTP triphosphohydrolase